MNTTSATPRPSRRSSSRVVLVACALVAVLVAAVAAGLRFGASGDDPDRVTGPQPGAVGVPGPTRTPLPGEPPFLASVSADGRYFLDQYGRPFLVKGDSPWSLMTDLSPEQMELYFENRRENGFNASIVSLIGAVANGAPSDDGATFDGILPFHDGDITRWNEGYWARAEHAVRTAAEQGNTLFLYPIDGWVMSTAFAGASLEDCFRYGEMVAERFSRYPNIAWMAGGDYFSSSNDASTGSIYDLRIDAVLRGIRSTGDDRPFSIQLNYQKSISSDSRFWSPRVDWNFVYSYYPTYKAVLDAYAARPYRPALFAEGNYERENNQGDTPHTTNETLRRQVLWALTSGSPGDVFGSDDWEFHDGWQDRLDTPAVAQVQRLRDLFGAVEWWRLVPDRDERLVLPEGRGDRLATDEPMDVLDNDYVTAARTPEGSLAVVYVPTPRSIRVDMSLLGATPHVRWVDPVSGATREADGSGRYTTPGVNADGDGDWLLVITASA